MLKIVIYNKSSFLQILNLLLLLILEILLFFLLKNFKYFVIRFLCEGGISDSNGGDLNIILNETYIERYITVMKYLLRIYILRMAHILKEQLMEKKLENCYGSIFSISTWELTGNSYANLNKKVF